MNKLSFNGINFNIVETEDGMYNIISDNGERILHKSLHKEKVIEHSKTINRKIEMLEKEGFEIKSNIELTHGFNRTEYLYKSIDNIDIYVFNGGDRKWNILGNKRYKGQDFICHVYADNLYDIKNDNINKVVDSIKDEINKK